MNDEWNAACPAWRVISSQAVHFLYLGFSDVFCVMFTEASRRCFSKSQLSNLREQRQPLLKSNICTDGNSVLSPLLWLNTVVPKSSRFHEAL